MAFEWAPAPAERRTRDRHRDQEPVERLRHFQRVRYLHLRVAIAVESIGGSAEMSSGEGYSHLLHSAMSLSSISGSGGFVR